MGVQMSTNRRVCEIQFSQILAFTADTSLCSPPVGLQEYEAMRNRRRRLGTSGKQLQNDSRLQSWASSNISSVIVVNGAFRNRYEARDFCANAIGLVRTAGIPVIWALNSKFTDTHKDLLILDVLKQLVLQALQINQTILTEQSIALAAHRFQSATTEQEWFNLLGSVLDGFPLIYIIIDVEVLGRRDNEELSWPSIFLEVFREMKRRGSSSVVAVALVSYGTTLVAASPSSDNHGVIHLTRKRAGPKSKKAVLSDSRRRQNSMQKPFTASSTWS